MDNEIALYQCETEWSELTANELDKDSCGDLFDLEGFQMLVRNTYELFLPYYLDLSIPLPRKYLMVVMDVLDFAGTPYISQTQSIARRIAQALCNRLNGSALRWEWPTPEDLPVCTQVNIRPGFLPVETPNGDVCELSLDSFDLTELSEGKNRWWEQEN